MIVWQRHIYIHCSLIIRIRGDVCCVYFSSIYLGRTGRWVEKYCVGCFDRPYIICALRWTSTNVLWEALDIVSNRTLLWWPHMMLELTCNIFDVRFLLDNCVFPSVIVAGRSSIPSLFAGFPVHSTLSSLFLLGPRHDEYIRTDVW